MGHGANDLLVTFVSVIHRLVVGMILVNFSLCVYSLSLITNVGRLAIQYQGEATHQSLTAGSEHLRVFVE